MSGEFGTDIGRWGSGFGTDHTPGADHHDADNDATTNHNHHHSKDHTTTTFAPPLHLGERPAGSALALRLVRDADA
jgi:hypothetical protein